MRENYLFFLQKINKYLATKADILAWCLMPNHFHFLIRATTKTCEIVKANPIKINAFSEGIRLLLSSYTKAINKQENFTGNLFQQKTKAKCINSGKDNYGERAFHYIHQNPLKAYLVNKLEDWEFSSFKDYAGMRNGKLCNKELARQLFNFNKNNFIDVSYQMIPEEMEKQLL